MRTLGITGCFLLVFWSGLCLAENQSSGDLLITTESTVRLDRLDLGTEVLTNVVVYDQTGEDIFIKHEAGLKSLKISELENRVLKRLGFPVEEEPPQNGWFGITNWEAFSDLLSGGVVRQFGILTAVGLVVVTTGLYLYTSYLFWLICVKTETPTGILVWLPFLQILSLFRAAGMVRSGSMVIGGVLLLITLARLHWTDCALFIDLANALVMTFLWGVWALRICRARKKSPVVAFLLLLPGVNYFALLYLAGSR